MHKGLLGASIFILLLAVLCYVYEVTVYTELFGMKIPYRKEYPLRNLAFTLGFNGIFAFGLSIALPSKHRQFKEHEYK